MKKLFIVLGISAGLAMGACETPAPAANPDSIDSSATTQPDSTSAQTDTSTNKPDSMPNP